MLGNRFSVLTQWDPWIGALQEGRAWSSGSPTSARRSARSTPRPTSRTCSAARRRSSSRSSSTQGCSCIEDGADVICLGSTTMHQARRTSSRTSRAGRSTRARSRTSSPRHARPRPVAEPDRIREAPCPQDSDGARDARRGGRRASRRAMTLPLADVRVVAVEQFGAAKNLNASALSGSSGSRCPCARKPMRCGAGCPSRRGVPATAGRSHSGS